MTTQLDDLLARLVLMQKDVFTGSDAAPVFFYAQESTPYWVNRISGFSVELESENLHIITYTIDMRLILAAVTEGFESEAERQIHAWLPVILQYFGQRRQLKRTSADAPLAYLYPRGAHILSGQANYNLQTSGIGQTYFGIDFSLEAPMYQNTDQLIW